MWYIETDAKQPSDPCFTVKICVNDGVFSNSLTDRLKVYPSYIGINTSWWSITKPYTPYITPFPDDGAILIKVNKTMQIHIPKLLFQGQKQKLIDRLVTELLTWLDDEFAIYQKEWRSKVLSTY